MNPGSESTSGRSGQHQRSRVLYALVALVLLGSFGPALADIEIAATKTLTDIATTNTKATLSFTPAISSPETIPNCGANSSISAVIDWGTTAENKNMFMAALAAFHAGSKVGFSLGACDTNAALVTRLYVKP
jgi:hypothetical protein